MACGWGSLSRYATYHLPLQGMSTASYLPLSALLPIIYHRG
jgi:hypothetical protein